MQILTVENQGIAINSLQDEIDDDMRFSVFDNSDTENPDFYFVPLVFLESFSAPTAVLQIGTHKIHMPLDWSVAVGDDVGTLEVYLGEEMVGERQLVALENIEEGGLFKRLFDQVQRFFSNLISNFTS